MIIFPAKERAKEQQWQFCEKVTFLGWWVHVTPSKVVGDLQRLGMKKVTDWITWLASLQKLNLWNSGTRWFNTWPLDSLVGGHLTSERVHIKPIPERSRFRRIARQGFVISFWFSSPWSGFHIFLEKPKGLGLNFFLDPRIDEKQHFFFRFFSGIDGREGARHSRCTLRKFRSSGRDFLLEMVSWVVEPIQTEPHIWKNAFY